MTNKSSSLDEQAERLAGQMTLLEHLEELRDRLVMSAIVVGITTAVAAIFTPQILELLISPYGQRLQIISPTEGITVYFRVALTGGLIIAMPFLVYQLLMFILPGLEDSEKQYIFWGVPSATALFLVGVAFAWFILIPAAIGFLSGFLPEIFSTEWRSKEYIPFVTSLVFWIGLAFETPLIIFIMSKLKLVTPQFLIKQWRFAVVIIAIAAAMITPTPDPFNMGLVMLPLFGLYAFSILLSYLA
ncbi:MAG: twin-arginine translocase subunit TatC [Anaerolineae bacterium]|nr:twin-arginine translocase subunit TatC [Anaerolineae bacterium]